MKVTVKPHEVTPLQGTRVGLLWYGVEPVTVSQGEHGIWDVSVLVRRGEVLGFVVLLDHPELPPWPLTALPRRAWYRSSADAQ